MIETYDISKSGLSVFLHLALFTALILEILSSGVYIFLLKKAANYLCCIKLIVLIFSIILVVIYSILIFGNRDLKLLIKPFGAFGDLILPGGCISLPSSLIITASGCISLLSSLIITAKCFLDNQKK